MVIELDAEGQEAGQILLLSVDGVLGLTGNLDADVLPHQGCETRVRIGRDRGSNVMLKIMDMDQGMLRNRFPSYWDGYLPQKGRSVAYSCAIEHHLVEVKKKG
jgi:hypothetical protein